MKTPYHAVLTNKSTGERLTAEVLQDHVNSLHGKSPVRLVRITGCKASNCFTKSEWTVHLIVKVPIGLGAVVEGRDGVKYVRTAERGLRTWRSNDYDYHYSCTDDRVVAVLRDGGRVLSEGVQP